MFILPIDRGCPDRIVATGRAERIHRRNHRSKRQRGGIISPTDNPAGIIAPIDSLGISTVNGDMPPGPPNSHITSGEIHPEADRFEKNESPGPGSDHMPRMDAKIYDEEIRFKPGDDTWA